MNCWTEWRPKDDLPVHPPRRSRVLQGRIVRRPPDHQVIAEFLKICVRLYERGFVCATDGNVSVKLDDQHLLCTPTSVCKGDLTARDLVVIDRQGRVLEGSRKPSTEIRMHQAWYDARPDIEAVVHAHPVHATAFAASGLAMDSCVFPEIIVTLGSVPLAPYATPSTEEVPESLGPLLPHHDAILLGNHGVVTCGISLTAAWHAMERVEHSAHILLLSSLLGGPRTLNSDELSRLRAISLTNYGIDPTTRPTCR